MVSKFLFPLLLLFSSWATRISSQGLADLVNGAASTSSCAQKLIPCQAYLIGSSTPPDSCCGPLKEVVADDAQCLCQVFDKPDLLTSLGITQAGALALAKTCGVDADVSVCNKGAATTPTTLPFTPVNGSTLSNATATAADALKDADQENGAPSHLAGSAVVTLCFALTLSKF